MAPAIHLLASWIIASKTTDNLRDRRLVTLAGIAPDLDGVGLLVDLLSQGKTAFYGSYHHILLHGIFGGMLISVPLTLFAQRRWRVFLLALLVFHFHLLCDLAGSRGPSPEDLWPIFYFGPFSKDPVWVWKDQWELYGVHLRWVSALLFAWTMHLAVRQGDWVVGVFNRRLDASCVEVLRKWATKWKIILRRRS